ADGGRRPCGQPRPPRPPPARRAPGRGRLRNPRARSRLPRSPLRRPSMPDEQVRHRAPAALVLVDVVQSFDFEGSEALLDHAEPASKALAKLRRHARKAGLPVVYANDHFGGWTEDFSTLVARSLK